MGRHAPAGDSGCIPGSGRCPGEGSSSPLQYAPECHGQREPDPDHDPWGRSELGTAEQLRTEASPRPTLKCVCAAGRVCLSVCLHLSSTRRLGVCLQLPLFLPLSLSTAWPDPFLGPGLSMSLPWLWLESWRREAVPGRRCVRVSLSSVRVPACRWAALSGGRVLGGGQGCGLREARGRERPESTPVRPRPQQPPWVWAPRQSAAQNGARGPAGGCAWARRRLRGPPGAARSGGGAGGIPGWRRCCRLGLRVRVALTWSRLGRSSVFSVMHSGGRRIRQQVLIAAPGHDAGQPFKCRLRGFSCNPGTISAACGRSVSTNRPELRDP